MGSPGPLGPAGYSCQDGAETSPAPEAPWELPVLPGGPRGCRAGGTQCVRVQVPGAASPRRALHPCVVWPWQPKRLLQPGPPRWVPGCLQSHRMPGSLHSSSGQAGARGFPKMSVTLSWFRTAGAGAGGKDAVVSSGSYDAPLTLAVPIPAGSSRCATGHVRIRQVQRSERCEVRPPPSRAGLGRIWVPFRQ